MAWQTVDRVAAPSPARPQLVTAAAVVLITIGALQAFAGMVFLFASPQQLASIASMGNVRIEPLAEGFGFFILVVGSLEIIAGISCFDFRRRPRFAIFLASIGGGRDRDRHGRLRTRRGDAGAVRLRHLRALRHAAAFRGTRRGYLLGPAGVAQPGSASDL